MKGTSEIPVELGEGIIYPLLSYFFVKKIPLSRRVEYVMDGSMDHSVSESVSESVSQ